MYLVLGFLAIIFPFLYKYSYVINNQYEHIPIILSFLDKNFLQNDWYVNAARSFGPRTFFAFYMAKTSQILSLPGTFFLHYIIFIFFVCIASYRLSKFFFRNNYVSLLTVVTVLFGSTFALGGDYLMTRDFYASQLPLGLLLFGITGILDGNYIVSAICFSIASYFHPQVGIIGGFIVFLAHFVGNFNRTKSKKLIKALFLFNFINLPLYQLYIEE